MINLNLKFISVEEIIPYLTPHIIPDAKISGSGHSLTIRSTQSNINELLIIIGDIDKQDFVQLAISITMDINSIHNVNTRSIHVGENTWTKINYGITYSKRVREKLSNGNLIEKIEHINVIESIQLFTKIENNNDITLRFRETLINPENDLYQRELDEVKDISSIIKINGKLDQWINISNAIKLLYQHIDEDQNIKQERQNLTRNMGIKIQLLQ